MTDQMAFTPYHHYIPQFMLRKFAIPQPVNPAIAPSPNPKRERQRRMQLKRKALLKVVNLDSDPPVITSELVRRTFGQQDMYKDANRKKREEQQRIENKLSTIEGAASLIINRVVDAHESGKEGISLSRQDKDLLRKYQFIMRYRGRNFFRRFDYETAEEYASDDKRVFLEYMKRKGFSCPRDVWFDNLTKMIDMRMDPECNWMSQLFKEIYPPDALWFISSIREMHLAFVTPSDPNEEFILTENAFGIHEGPVSYSVNRFTGEKTETASTQFHLLNVISPRLVMVFRHNSMPEPFEDMDPEACKQRSDKLAQAAWTHNDPEHVKSLLQEFPLPKPRNSYTRLENGRIFLAEGEDGKPRAHDKFHFVFVRLESGQIQTINMVMLDQAHEIDKLVFKSEIALRKALEFYLDYPCQTNGTYSIKTISESPDDPMLHLFRKLEHVARSLGSNVKARYHVDPLMEDDGELSFDDTVSQVLRTVTPVLPDNPFALPMTVLLAVLEKTEMNIRATYALDRIFEGHGLSKYPDLVYAAIQVAHRKNPSQRTRSLLDIERRVWMDGWRVLVEKAIQMAGVNFDDDIIAIGGKLKQLGYDLPTEILPIIERTTLSSKMRRPNESKRDSQPGLSIQGLHKAFDDIGRDMEKRNSPSFAENLINRSSPQPTSGAIRSSQGNSLRHEHQAMKIKSEASPGDFPATIRDIQHYQAPSTTAPSLWKVGIYLFLLWLAWRDL